MAHLVETMAFVGQTPWHGLGHHLPTQQPIEVWAQQAGMDWDIRETPVRFITGAAGNLGAIESFPDNKVLFRSDTNAPLSVVSQRYQVVQGVDPEAAWRRVHEHRPECCVHWRAGQREDAFGHRDRDRGHPAPWVSSPLPVHR